MNLSTIEMTREEAEAALAEWGQEVKAQKCTPEDEAIAAGYRELAKGHKLIALSDTIRAGGEDELARPRLAVAPAISNLVYLYRNQAGAHEHEANGHPGYVAFLRWLKGQCFPTLDEAWSAYEEATA